MRKARRKRPLADRFWEKVDVRGPDECWPWMALITQDGHGQITAEDGKMIGAHRVAVLLDGRNPMGFYVLHSCNNPKCVNPKHLRLGTHRENMQDALAASSFNWFKPRQRKVYPKNLPQWARPLAARYWECVDVHGPDECWLWTGNKVRDGYGVIYDGKGKNVRSHRLAVIFDGRDPKGLNVLHSCNNRACVNPRHLRIGTQKENMQDAKKAGTHYQFEHKSGEEHYRTTLTGHDVHRIRLMAEAGMKCADIARIYELHPSVIHSYIAGIKWKNLPPLNIISSWPENLERRKGSERLTPDEAAAIKEQRRAGKSLKAIAEEFGVSIATVSICARGLTWR